MLTFADVNKKSYVETFFELLNHLQASLILPCNLFLLESTLRTGEGWMLNKRWRLNKIQSRSHRRNTEHFQLNDETSDPP